MELTCKMRVSGKAHQMINCGLYWCKWRFYYPSWNLNSEIAPLLCVYSSVQYLHLGLPKLLHWTSALLSVTRWRLHLPSPGILLMKNWKQSISSIANGNICMANSGLTSKWRGEEEPKKLLVSLSSVNWTKSENGEKKNSLHLLALGRICLDEDMQYHYYICIFRGHGHQGINQCEFTCTDVKKSEHYYFINIFTLMVKFITKKHKKSTKLTHCVEQEDWFFFIILLIPWYPRWNGCVWEWYVKTHQIWRRMSSPLG